MGSGSSVQKRLRLREEELRSSESELAAQRRDFASQSTELARERAELQVALRSSEGEAWERAAALRKSEDEANARAVALRQSEDEASARAAALRQSEDEANARVAELRAELRMTLDASGARAAVLEAECEERACLLEEASKERRGVDRGLREEVARSEAETWTYALHECAEKAERDSALRGREVAEACAQQYHVEAQQEEQTVSDLMQELKALCSQKDEVAAALGRQRADNLKMRRALGSVGCLEESLVELRSEHLESERMCAHFENCAHEQTGMLRSELSCREGDLDRQSEQLRQKDKELDGLTLQATGLQTVINDMKLQLQGEIGRVEKMHNLMESAAGQGRELEATKCMLAESHSMLAMVRDALKSERAEREKTSSLLEQEQMRTKMLVGVLTTLKERLRGLTPKNQLALLANPATKKVMV